MSMSLDFIFVSCMFLNDSTSYSEEQEQVEEEQKINEPSSYGFQPDGKCVFFSPIEFRDICRPPYLVTSIFFIFWESK